MNWKCKQPSCLDEARDVLLSVEEHWPTMDADTRAKWRQSLMSWLQRYYRDILMPRFEGTLIQPAKLPSTNGPITADELKELNTIIAENTVATGAECQRKIVYRFFSYIKQRRIGERSSKWTPTFTAALLEKYYEFCNNNYAGEQIKKDWGGYFQWIASRQSSLPQPPQEVKTYPYTLRTRKTATHHCPVCC